MLAPSMAEAAVCKLKNAIFRPKYAGQHFEIRSSRAYGVPGFALTVRKTSETFRSRMDVNQGRTDFPLPHTAGARARRLL